MRTTRYVPSEAAVNQAVVHDAVAATATVTRDILTSEQSTLPGEGTHTLLDHDNVGNRASQAGGSQLRDTNRNHDIHHNELQDNAYAGADSVRSNSTTESEMNLAKAAYERFRPDRRIQLQRGKTFLATIDTVLQLNEENKDFEKVDMVVSCLEAIIDRLNRPG